jgi:hypothetical protein
MKHPIKTDWAGMISVVYRFEPAGLIHPAAKQEAGLWYISALFYS